MSARTQHGWVVAGALLCLVALAACADTATVSPPASQPSSSSPDLTMPTVRIPGLHTTHTTFDATIAEESAHPDTMSAALQQAGFLGGVERTLTGRRAVFSRVVVRGWVFTSADGASSFVSWLGTNAPDLIGQVKQLDASLPNFTVLLLHSPTGCCHEEVPIYLAIWQRGSVAWTIRASGATIHTAPVLALVRSTHKET